LFRGLRALAPYQGPPVIGDLSDFKGCMVGVNGTDNMRLGAGKMTKRTENHGKKGHFVNNNKHNNTNANVII